MTSLWQSMGFGDATARRAILASVVLHVLVLVGMGAYLLQSKVSSPGVSAIVFEFPKKVAAPIRKPVPVKPRVAKPVQTKVQAKASTVKPPPRASVQTQPRIPQTVKPRASTPVAPVNALPLPKPVSQTFKPPLGKPLPRSFQTITLKQTSPLLTPKPSQPQTLPNLNPNTAKPNLLRSGITSTSGTEKPSALNNKSGSSATDSGIARSSNVSPSGTERLQLASVRSSAAQAGETGNPLASGTRTTTSLTPEASGLAGNSTPTSGRETGVPTSQSRPTSQAATGGTSSNQTPTSTLDTRPSGTPNNPTSSADSTRPSQSGGITPSSSVGSGLSTSSNRPGSAASTDTRPTGTNGSGTSGVDTGQTNSKPGVSSTSAGGSAPGNSSTSNSSGKVSGIAGSGTNNSSTPGQGLAGGSGTSISAGGATPVSGTSGSSTPGSGLSSKPTAPASTGTSSKPSTPSAPASIPEKSPLGVSPTQTTGSESSKPANTTTSGTENTNQACAILVDARGLKPAMTASESPAIVDPSGQKIWPNPNAIQNVNSSQVIETGIAQFASSQVQALGFLVPGVKPLEVRAIRAVPAEGVSGGFLDFVMVSSDDAKLILALKRNCQVVFIK